MSAAPLFRLVPMRELRAHETVDDATVDRLVREIRTSGVFAEPIWVDAPTMTILNGHHRFRALERLGARRVPAWLFAYRDDERVVLDRWSRGPTISKEEVVRRAREGRLFPIKTTRHRILHELPPRSVPLSELLAPSAPAARPRAGSGAKGSSPHR